MQIRVKGSKLQFLRASWDSDAKRTRQKMILSISRYSKSLTDEEIEKGGLTQDEIAQFGDYVAAQEAMIEDVMERHAIGTIIEHLGYLNALIKKDDKQVLKRTDVNKLDRELSKTVALLEEHGYKLKNLGS